MTRIEFAKKNKKHICSTFFDTADDNCNEARQFYFIIDKNEYDNNWPTDKNIIKASTFKELMLNAVIKGIDLDDINFNKLSYVKEVNDFLRLHRVDHFEKKHIEDEEEFIKYS